MSGLIPIGRYLSCLPLVLAACSPASFGVVAGYDLSEPERSIELPSSLREISSVVAIGDDELACLQDEKGSLYFIDLGSGEVTRRIKFGKKGDYEGLAYREGTFWVLRSDGRVYQLALAGDRYRIVREVRAETGHAEYEGLAMDEHSEQLILAPKDRFPGRSNSGQRELYRIDPQTLELDSSPWMLLQLDALRSANQALGLGKPKLRFSDVAVDPGGERLWLLSAVDRLLLVVARDGTVLGQHVFGEEELPQPEGATFLPDGRLVIASEGVGGPAWLRIYKRVE